MKKLKMKYMAMAVMVLGIATVSFLACRFTKENKDSNIYGVDLSHHNYVEDWDQVTASFVYLKATEGATHQDKTGHLQKCVDRYTKPVVFSFFVK